VGRQYRIINSHHHYQNTIIIIIIPTIMCQLSNFAITVNRTSIPSATTTIPYVIIYKYQSSIIIIGRPRLSRHRKSSDTQNTYHHHHQLGQSQWRQCHVIPNTVTASSTCKIRSRHQYQLTIEHWTMSPVKSIILSSSPPRQHRNNIINATKSMRTTRTT